MRTIPNISLGNSTAEQDTNLKSYYVSSNYFDWANDFNSKKTFFIGRKGIGKSAILEYIRQKRDSNMVVNINHDDFAFKLLQESDLIRDISQSNTEIISKYLWKYLVITEILKNAFGIKKPFFPFTKADKIYRFLEDCGEITENNASMSERLLNILRRIKVSVGNSDLNVGAELKTSDGHSLSQIEVFREIDNLTERLPDLLKHKKYFILVDDLDAGWQNIPIQNQFLRALFKTLFKLISSPCLKFVICLREDIFQQINLEDSDKFQDYIVEMQWDEEFLKSVIEQRLSFCFSIDQNNVWKELFVNKISNQTPFTYIFQRTLCRPRDIIQFTQACVEKASRKQHKQITEGDIRGAEPVYSKRKLKDLANEYQYVYPNLDRVFAFFSGRPRDLDYSQLEVIVFNILESAEKQNSGDRTNCKWVLNYYDDWTNLIRILIEIDFIGYRPTKREPVCFGYQKMPATISNKFRYRIHECFVSALDLR